MVMQTGVIARNNRFYLPLNLVLAPGLTCGGTPPVFLCLPNSPSKYRTSSWFRATSPYAAFVRNGCTSVNERSPYTPPISAELVRATGVRDPPANTGEGGRRKAHTLN